MVTPESNKPFLNHWLPVPELLCKVTDPPEQNVVGPDAVIVGTEGTANILTETDDDCVQPLPFVTV